jgi:hypothetical protein
MPSPHKKFLLARRIARLRGDILVKKQKLKVMEKKLKDMK